MYETTIAGKCCSQIFIAITNDAPRLGSLIPCMHCEEIIELAYENAVTSAISESEWSEWDNDHEPRIANNENS